METMGHCGIVGSLCDIERPNSGVSGGCSGQQPKNVDLRCKIHLVGVILHCSPNERIHLPGVVMRGCEQWNGIEECLKDRLKAFLAGFKC